MSGLTNSNFKRVTKVTHAPMPSSEPFEADDPMLIEVGMQVEHQKFGTGTVNLLEGNFPEIKATVSFPGHGSKSLLLRYARLRIIKS